MAACGRRWSNTELGLMSAVDWRDRKTEKHSREGRPQDLTDTQAYRMLCSSPANKRICPINTQITYKYTSIFIMYFIQNILTNMFRSVFWPSSGWCFNTRIQNVTMRLIVSRHCVTIRIITKTALNHCIITHHITASVICHHSARMNNFNSPNFNNYPILTYSYITYSLTHSMMQSPSWAANWFAASQEIPRISRNPKVHYRTHKCQPPVSILGQPNPVHISTSHLLEIRPNTIHPSKSRSPSGFPTKTLYTPSPHPYAPHAQPISFFPILSPAQHWVSSTAVI